VIDIRHFQKVILTLGVLLLGQAWAQDLQVTTQALSELAVKTTRSAPAMVKSGNRSVVASQLDAQIIDVRVEVAQTVEKGELLIALDARDFQFNLDEAIAVLQSLDARISQAKLRLKRSEELKQRDYASADDLLARQTDLAVLKADRKAQSVVVARARAELEKTKIRAPFSGVIVAKQAQLGAFARRGTAVLTLVDHRNVELEADLIPTEVNSLQNASSMMFSAANQQWPVSLVRVSEVVEEASRVVKVRLGFNQNKAAVGMSGDLVWIKPELTMPASLILKRNGKLGLFLLRNQTAEFFPLANAQEGRPATVNLPIDTQIIVNGRERLQGGETVRVGS